MPKKRALPKMQNCPACYIAAGLFFFAVALSGL